MLIGISDPLGAKADRLRCEVFQNLILIPINTGTLRHAVATALTVYGIETSSTTSSAHSTVRVATALTVYGIETIVTYLGLKPIAIPLGFNSPYRLRY